MDDHSQCTTTTVLAEILPTQCLQDGQSCAIPAWGLLWSHKEASMEAHLNGRVCPAERPPACDAYMRVCVSVSSHSWQRSLCPCG